MTTATATNANAQIEEWVTRTYVPALLDLVPELRPHAAALRAADVISLTLAIRIHQTATTAGLNSMRNMAVAPCEMSGPPAAQAWVEIWQEAGGLAQRVRSRDGSVDVIGVLLSASFSAAMHAGIAAAYEALRTEVDGATAPCPYEAARAALATARATITESARELWDRITAA